MNNDHEPFPHINDALRLSSEEKSAGRHALQVFMQEHPVRTPVRSPFTRLFLSPALRYAFGAVLVLGLGTGGVAYAAQDASPSSPLYVVKVKVNEPVQVSFTFDQKKRADLEVALVNKRLQEVAEASVDGTLTPSQTALVSDSLSAHLASVQDDISDLTTAHADDAFDTASDLAATLSAHAAILDKVQDANPDTSAALQPVVDAVADAISSTADLVDSTQDAVVDTSATTTLSEPTDTQADNTDTALAEVKQEVADALASFDASDRTDVNASIADIQATIAEADVRDAAGDTTAAYLLYTEANQNLTSLKLTIEADQSLNLDVIDASSTDALDASETSDQ